MSAFRGYCSLCCTYRTVGAILRLLHLRGCSSLCCTDRAIGTILRLVHLRQVHPLRLLGWCATRTVVATLLVVATLTLAILFIRCATLRVFRCS